MNTVVIERDQLRLYGKSYPIADSIISLAVWGIKA